MMPELPTNEERARLTPALVAMGLKTLSVRAMAYISLGLTAGGFGYVLSDPTILKLVGVSVFALFVLVFNASQSRGGSK